MIIVLPMVTNGPRGRDRHRVGEHAARQLRPRARRPRAQRRPAVRDPRRPRAPHPRRALVRRLRGDQRRPAPSRAVREPAVLVGLLHPDTHRTVHARVARPAVGQQPGGLRAAAGAEDPPARPARVPLRRPPDHRTGINQIGPFTAQLRAAGAQAARVLPGRARLGAVASADAPHAARREPLAARAAAPRDAGAGHEHRPGALARRARRGHRGGRGAHPRVVADRRPCRGASPGARRRSSRPGAPSTSRTSRARSAGLGLLAPALAPAGERRRPIAAAVALLCAVAVVHAVKGLDVEEAGHRARGIGGRRARPRRRAAGARPSRATAAAATAALLALLASRGLAAWSRSRGPEPTSGRGALASHRAARRRWPPARAAAVQGDEGAAPCTSSAALRRRHGRLVRCARSRPARARDGHDAREPRAGRGASSPRTASDSIAPFVLRADKAFFFAARRRAGLPDAARDRGRVRRPGRAGRRARRRSSRASWPSRAAAAGTSSCWRRATSISTPTGRSGCGRCGSGSRPSCDPRGLRRSRAAASRRCARPSRGSQRHGWTVEVVRGAELTPAAVAELARRRARLARPPPAAVGLRDGDGPAVGRARRTRATSTCSRATRGRGPRLPALRAATAAASRSTRCAGSTTSPTGINDALVAAALAHARDRGCGRCSLNFAGFAHVMAAEHARAPQPPRCGWALRRLHGRFQLERLARFATKFGPDVAARATSSTRRGRGCRWRRCG